MAAQKAVVLENSLKLFTETKTGERVSLELQTGCVYIYPEAKYGSITLGSFWVRVLQNYFPKSEFRYAQRYSNKHGSETLSVNAEGYKITVYLRTGLVTFEGDFVYEWFRMVFRRVMEAYDRATNSSTEAYYADQIIMDTRAEIQKRERVISPRRHEPELIDPNIALVSSDVRLPETSLQLLESRRLDNPDRVNNQLVSCKKTPTCGLGLLALRDSEKYIYPMWKQLLASWLSDEWAKVYICSSDIDASRLQEITALAYKNRLVMKLEAIYMAAVPNNGQRMTKLREDVLRGHTADEQLFIEYKVFNKILIPTTKHIGSNFIASVKSGVAEILVTSAPFNLNGLATPNCLHSAALTKMPEEDFVLNFLDKLATV